MEPTRYYRIEPSDVIVRLTGTVVEKKGADNTWKRAPELLYKFASGDVNLIEISQAEADAPVCGETRQTDKMQNTYMEDE